MRELRVCCGVVFALALAASIAAPASAQQIEARILGRLVDSSGAALPGVTVTATATQTGATRVLVTEAEGDFAITNLGPGAYTVQFELPGFATETRQIVLGLAQVETVNLTMGTATVTEAVTVSASANVIDLSSAKIGVNVSPEEIQSLPVNGRNFANLMTLATSGTFRETRCGGRASGRRI
jgi:Carboxypeptidase regulatory-like domain